MPSSNIPPEEQREVKPFDPLVLDRTVIAVPLLKEMQEDLEFTAKVEIPQDFNAVIEFNDNFSGGANAAREEALKMTDRAKDKARKASEKRLKSAEKETAPDARKRHDALLEAIDKLTIGSLRRTGYSFAFLHAAIIRRLLAENERFGLPFAQIYPKRFEIIIDLNLEQIGRAHV